MASTDKYDLLILVDATASMRSFLHSLNTSLPQIISISALTGCFDRVGLLAYRDYCHGDKIIEWSGWTAPTHDGDGPDLVGMASKLNTLGGYDWPEAVKTGLAKAYEVMRTDATTLILHYADAPPHLARDEGQGSVNYGNEQTALNKPQSFGGCGPLFADWVSAARVLATGTKRANVICLLDDHGGGTKSGTFNFLSAVTGGACVHLQRRDARSISELSIEILMTWMGVKKQGVTAAAPLPARLSWYPDLAGITEVASESDRLFSKFMAANTFHGYAPVDEENNVTRQVLEERLPSKMQPVQDFAKTYKEDEQYRTLVTKHLRRVIEFDVTAVSLNPVFGSLWRAVCNDRDNENRQELLDLFGRKVNEIQDSESRANMKTWLEESYDYTAEVLEAIDSVPEAEHFPFVCLDPTLVFAYPDVDHCQNDDEEASRPIMDFKREELLEIGRSCDYRVLRRLGTVLTRLTFVKSAEAMPKHIADTKNSDVPKIPLALASKKHKRRFWRILLHIVVPGTMLGGRAGAVLASLVIRMGIKPLIKPAEEELLLWRERWNNLDVPETWNVSCLTLLLDADTAYRADGRMFDEANGDECGGLLRDSDRRLFERLIEYKMLESNLDTTLTAKVAWTPEGTSMPVGPVVRCKTCQYPRSVTIMANDGICGLCCFYDENGPMPEEKAAQIPKRVSRSDDEKTKVTWFECNVQTCRAQYVVHHVEALNVRPKCHYCRVGKAAPLLECTKCLSRMIWPEEYRSETAKPFLCMGCDSGRRTVVEVETTAKALREANGDDWLLTIKRNQITSKLGSNRSLYSIASTSQPLNTFAENVTVLPGMPDEKQLSLRGRVVQNTPDLIRDLRTWIDKRRTEAGECPLCFRSFRKSDLLPACGRSGCKQMVCTSCLSNWYGINAPGRIINTKALHCSFCIRAPTARTMARHSQGVHAVGNLKDAVAHAGEWIYAWCKDCGHAKQFMERVCAQAVPMEISDWECEDCEEAKGPQNRMKIRPCPGCGIETEKVSGCDHLECPCGTHWCFFCGEKQDEDGIYSHMSETHGGYYGGQRADEYESDEEDIWGVD